MNHANYNFRQINFLYRIQTFTLGLIWSHLSVAFICVLEGAADISLQNVSHQGILGILVYSFVLYYFAGVFY
jgi:hypothetical protein